MRELDKLWYPSAPEPLWQLPLTLALDALELMFGAVVATRSKLFETGALRVERVPGIKVISVGNLTVGGAGKTPAVMYLSRRLAAAGQRVAIASRGYGRRSTTERLVKPDDTVDDAGDEPLLLKKRVPQADVWVGARRASLATQARAAGAQVVLLDDGLQHRRLHRDVDLLVVDARAGFGNGRLLPRGPLREPLTAITRVHALWLKTDDVNATPPPGTEQLALIRASHFAAGVRAPDGTVEPVATLKGQRVVAYAGLARPTGFLRSLDALGADVRAYAFYPDHHPFTDGQLASLEAHAREHRARLITTEKDAMRIPAGHPTFQLVQDVRILSGEDVLRSLLR